MSRHQDRTWYVLPKARKMRWKAYDEHADIDIDVIAFAFMEDTLVWLTANGTIVNGTEAQNREWDDQ